MADAFTNTRGAGMDAEVNKRTLRFRFADVGVPAQFRAPVRIFLCTVLVFEGAHEGGAAAAIGHQPSSHIRCRLRRTGIVWPFPGNTSDDCGTQSSTADLLARPTGIEPVFPP